MFPKMPNAIQGNRIMRCAIFALIFSLVGSRAFGQMPDPINGSVTFKGTVECAPGGVSNSICYSLNVQCSGIDGSGIASLPVTLKVNNPGSLKGTVVFTAAGGATAYYDEQTTYSGLLMNSVIHAGFTVVQAKFGSASLGLGGWAMGPASDGPRALACRYAAVATWIFKNTNRRPLIHRTNTAMCATGISFSSSAIGYALAHFGLGSGVTRIFDMVEITSGPTVSRVDYGCICDQPPVFTPAGQGLLSGCAPTVAANVDGSYGGNLCSSASKTHDRTNAALFRHDSIMSDDPPFLNYKTDVHVILGAEDTSAAIPQAFGWVNNITSPMTVEVIGDAAHFVPDVLDGAVKIANDLTTSCVLQH